MELNLIPQDFTEFLSNNGIKFVTSLGRYPSSNGQAENVVQYKKKFNKIY